MPDDSGETVVTMLVCLLFFAYEAAGASRARHSLRPHLCWAGKFMHHSGVEPPRECGRVRGLSDALIARSESDESMFRRHARPCAGHPRPFAHGRQERGWPGRCAKLASRSPAMTQEGIRVCGGLNRHCERERSNPSWPRQESWAASPLHSSQSRHGTARAPLSVGREKKERAVLRECGGVLVVLPSLRALAKQSILAPVRKLDCFVVSLLAMTAPQSAGATSPHLHPSSAKRGEGEDRAAVAQQGNGVTSRLS